MELNLYEKEKIEEVLKPQILSMRDTSGKKVDFEIVTVLTLEKHIYIVVKNPSDKSPRPRLVVFEAAKVKGQLRYILVQNKQTIVKINEAWQQKMQQMDSRGIIPHDD